MKMKKRWIFAAFVAIFALAVVGCGGGDDDDDKKGTPTVSGVTINGDSTILLDGTGSATYTATVTGTNSPAQSVTWAIDSGASGTTTISSGGILTVDKTAQTNASEIVIKATSTVDTTKSGTKSVFVYTNATSVPTVTSVTVTAASSATVVKKGATLQFSATVAGNNNPPQTVTWEVEGGGAGTFINAAGLLTVSASEVALAELDIIATSAFDDSVSSTAVTVTVITEQPGPNPNLVEVLALENGTQAVYKFVLPDGMTFGDFVAIKATYQLAYVTSAAGEGQTGAQQLRTLRLHGNYTTSDFITSDGGVELNAHVAKFDDKNGSYIANGVHNGAVAWSWDYSKIPGFDAANPGSEFDLELDLIGTGGSESNGHWPSADAEGPFYFAIGIPGTAGDHIVWIIKDVSLVVKPALLAFGYGNLYSEGSGFADGKPAFAGYAPFPKENSVYRAPYETIADLPATIKFNWKPTGKGAGEKPRAAVFEAGLTWEDVVDAIDATGALGNDISLAEPEGEGWIFEDWYLAFDEDTKVYTTPITDAYEFTSGPHVLYAKWARDPSFLTPQPVADHPDAGGAATTLVLGTTSWNNNATQRGWDTYNATNPTISVGHFTWARYIEITAKELNSLEFVWHTDGAGWVGCAKQFGDTTDADVWLEGTDAVTVVDNEDGTYTATVDLSIAITNNYAGFIARPDSSWVGLLFQLQDWVNNVSKVKLIIPAAADWADWHDQD